MKNKKKCPVCRALKLVTTILGVATGTLLWAYARVNEIFDRKEVDIKF